MWKPRTVRRLRIIPGPGRLIRRLLVASVISYVCIKTISSIINPEAVAYDPHLYEDDSDYPTSSPSTYSPGEKPLVHGKIFISANFWNNGWMLRAHWNAALIALVNVLGKENVYVSVYENGSWDDTKSALQDLDMTLAKMEVNKTVFLDERIHKDEVTQYVGPNEEKPGWIMTPRGKKEMRRLPMLAELRNKSLKPLEDMVKGGTNFDRILFLSDVIFTPQDVLNLLKTRGGNYTAACGMDFNKPYKFQDTFALRDINGREMASLRYPYFPSGPSRDAILKKQPVPVKSCWNGLAIFDAKPFTRSKNPLRFRAIADSLAAQHVEASECCLIHADNEEHTVRESSTSGKLVSSFDAPSRHGVYLNPRVRVGYSHDSYWHARASMDGFVEWFCGVAIRYYTGLLNQPWRDSSVQRKLKNWEARGSSTSGEKVKEKGWYCLVDEMQVMVENGWRHA